MLGGTIHLQVFLPNLGRMVFRNALVPKNDCTGISYTRGEGEEKGVVSRRIENIGFTSPSDGGIRKWIANGRSKEMGLP